MDRLTKEQAVELVDALDIDCLEDDLEDVEALQEHNPRLLEAYRLLLSIAEREGRCTG